MRQIKLRVIKSSTDTQTVVYGVTIPHNVALFYPETYFTVSRTDDGIKLTSGTKFNDIKNIKNIDLEKFKI